MSTPLHRIEKLLSFIPAKDIPFATSFIERRDFEALRDLVKSDIRILKRERKKELENQIEQLMKLKSEIESYLILLGDIGSDSEDFWGESKSYYD